MRGSSLRQRRRGASECVERGVGSVGEHGWRGVDARLISKALALRSARGRSGAASAAEARSRRASHAGARPPKPARARGARRVTSQLRLGSIGIYRWNCWRSWITRSGCHEPPSSARWGEWSGNCRGSRSEYPEIVGKQARGTGACHAPATRCRSRKSFIDSARSWACSSRAMMASSLASVLGSRRGPHG